MDIQDVEGKYVQDVLTHAHRLLSDVISPGDLAIDATVGNGYDTVFLAECVGSGGRVVGFDIQQEALDRAGERLQAAQLSDRVNLVCRSHSNMAEVVGEGARAITFNLGYLPGADKSITTEASTTIKALEAATELLLPGGIITAICYTGHPEGKEETRAVEHWAQRIDQQAMSVLSYRFINQKNDPPRLLAIKNTASGAAGAHQKLDFRAGRRSSEIEK